MDPGEIRRELERLAEQANATRTRLAELRERIGAACDLVAAIRSTVKGDESTPATRSAQGAVRAG